MKQAVEDERLIKQYLLGELADEQQTEIQDRFLTDPEFFNLLLLLENELTDEYLIGGLSESELERFNSYFLRAPERQQKLKFAKALNKYVSETATEPSQRVLAQSVGLVKWWRSLRDIIRSQNRLLVFSLATASLVLAAAGAALVVYRAGMKYEVAQVRDENAAQPAPLGGQELGPSTVPQSQTNQDSAKLKNQARPATSPALKSQKTGASQHEHKGEQEQTRAVLIKPHPSSPTTVETKSTPPNPPSGDVKDRLRTRSRRAEVGAQYAPPGRPRLAEGRPFQSLTLTAGTARDVTATRTVELASATEQLLLRLMLESGDYPTYHAEIRTAEGKVISSETDLRPRQTPSGKGVVLSVPAKLLVIDNYIVTLRGLSKDGDYERTGTYHFSVIKK